MVCVTSPYLDQLRENRPELHLQRIALLLQQIVAFLGRDDSLLVDLEVPAVIASLHSARNDSAHFSSNYTSCKSAQKTQSRNSSQEIQFRGSACPDHRFAKWRDFG